MDEKLYTWKASEVELKVMNYLGLLPNLHLLGKLQKFGPTLGIPAFDLPTSEGPTSG